MPDLPVTPPILGLSPNQLRVIVDVFAALAGGVRWAAGTDVVKAEYREIADAAGRGLDGGESR